jgi:hypothetical protein
MGPVQLSTVGPIRLDTTIGSCGVSAGGAAAKAACDAKTWTEGSERVDGQVVLTRRGGAEACCRHR